MVYVYLVISIALMLSVMAGLYYDVRESMKWFNMFIYILIITMIIAACITISEEEKDD